MDEPIIVTQGGAVSIEAPSLCIPVPIASALQTGLSISHLFDMQSAVVSYLSRNPDRDAIICAPTGSGKTLSYALPIVSRLSSRVVQKLRAVIVVPTRDLAAQVHRVVRALAAETDLKVSVADGTSSAKRECRAIEHSDVLISTPGRLVEHTKNSASFSLSAVEFLVLDESDRLLHDSYYSWVEVVLPECGKRPVRLDGEAPIGLAGLAIHPVLSSSGYVRRRPQIILASATQTRDPKRLALLDLQLPTQFVGALSSKGESGIGIGGPEPDDVNDVGDGATYRVPESLVERAYVVNGASEKPAALFKLLGLGGLASGSEGSIIEALPTTGSILVFTKSVEAAHRLTRLLEVVSFREGESRLSVLEMSGDLSMERRGFVLSTVQRAKTVIVCSDVLARGMDISGVDAVVNYDAPVHVNTYVHRVGRTARAGREGVSVSLVVAKQARHFKAMVRSVDRGDSKIRIRSIKSAEEFEGLVGDVESGLASLKRILRREQLGLVNTGLCVPKYVLRDLKRAACSFNDSPAELGPDVVEDKADPAEDDFSHLVRAQVARKFLSTSE